MRTNLSFTLDGFQGDGRFNVGIDMGHCKWSMDILDTETGTHRRHVFSKPTFLLDGLKKIRELVETGREVDVIYEAGRNGFTPARGIALQGARPVIVPVNKLEVLKTGKKAKSDRLDARALSERDARAPRFPSVWVPSIDQECQRRILNEELRLKKDIKRNNNRILSILERWPLPPESSHLSAAEWKRKLEHWRSNGAVGSLLPEVEFACIRNLISELEVLEKNLASWRDRRAAELARQRTEAAKKGQAHMVDVLMQYKSIGEETALGLAWYVGDFDRFSNGKKFSSYLGLTPVPWESGRMRRDQGISKSGRPELRRLMIELAWLWVRHQPESPITKKWRPQLDKRGRSRKTAIVAVARQLAVALFRLAKHGTEIEGATKNRELPVPAGTPGSPLAA